MTAPKGICLGCRELIEAGERTAYAVTGYEVDRGGGGQNHVIDHKRVDGQMWHARHSEDCFAKHRRGDEAQKLF